MKSLTVVEEIKKSKNLSLKTYFLSSYLISNRISPYISSIYISKKVLPNRITLHMIYSGIIGAIFFSLPNIYLKLIGAVFIHLWFILDCSDGEVARYTKTFSRYGKELDYMAHLIDHPLFGFSILMSLTQLGRYNTFYLVILVMLSNLVDYLNRNLYMLYNIIDLKEKERFKNSNTNFEKWTIKKKILFITNIFTIYPNFVLFGVIIYFVDYFANTNILLVYLILNVTLTFLFGSRSLIKITKKFYFSN
ncbi:CDP-alcohol phosphatidyltransferase family protein [Oceanirhabdus sp. W0125-5]|uniref:CDP-alcohol phosphatidyltransferase family protein n=1 Tax=Oceanirhabdus sp. W0125-5 TaxID=2999116 RepID=UPI0022F2C80E|nr:CDP-alcohol phosphatidyltransferase family protein [Oceanirhabdus sp. W0125-5]WBW98667.1 CDP-alcohol phosphatidyltransferase family protein [Oceanirhabdus sp. W0125-5]